ncbi:MAG: hypothetical protein IPJ48_02555 [Propionivibrio sp.]|uniref:Uncharacterized protein n=1 Tax=Candidatus Propionivibrio dominans TaxID=2954373 RepID=A0A9D7FCY4_9RHOO|nr:hypothetical protein [Candidatus Propionivibrio dominans]
MSSRVAQIDPLTAIHQEKKLLAVDHTQEQVIQPGPKNAHTPLASRNLMGELPDKLDLVISQAHRF